MSDAYASLRNTLAEDEMFSHYGTIFNGDVNQWWNTVPAERRAPFDNVTTGDPVAQSNSRSFLANRALMSDLFGASQGDVHRNYGAYSSRFASQLGIDPQASSHDIYKRVSQIMASAKVKRDRREDVRQSAINAAIGGTDPDFTGEFGAFEEEEPGLRAYHGATYRQMKRKVDQVFKKYERTLGRLALDSTGKITGEQFTEEELESFVLESKDDEFDVVVAMLAARGGEVADEKGTGKNMVEEFGRATQRIGRNIPRALRRNSLSVLTDAIKDGTDIIIAEDYDKDDPLGLVDSAVRASVRPTESLISGGGPIPGKERYAKPAERRLLAAQIDYAKRLDDRQSKLNQIAQGVIDPTRTGEFFNDWMVNVAGQAPIMATALTPHVGIPALAADITMQNYDEMRSEVPELDSDEAFKIAAASGIVEAASERVAAMFTFGRFKPPAITQTFPTWRKLVNTVGRGIVAENFQEGVQDFVLPVAQELYGEIPFEEEGKLWGIKSEVWERWRDERPEVFMTVLPYALLGGAVQTLQMPDTEFQDLAADVESSIEDMLSDEYVMKNVLGIDDATVKSIMEAGTTAEKAAIFSGATPNPGVVPDIVPDERQAGSLGIVPKVFRTIDPMNLASLRTPQQQNLAEATEQVQTQKLRGIREAMLADGRLPDWTRRVLNAEQFRGNRYATTFQHLAEDLQTEVNKLPENQRQPILDQANAVLLGNQQITLPAEINDIIQEARMTIDHFSESLVKERIVTNELAKTVGDNIGSYLTRSFRAFDPKSGWLDKVNFRGRIKEGSGKVWTAESTVDPTKSVVDVATDAIQQAHAQAGSPITSEEAYGYVKQMLHPDRGMGFLLGQRKVGKIDVTSFIRRKDLSQPILDLYGERRNPIENILITGGKLGKILASWETQKSVRKTGLDLGVFSETETPTHSTQLFPNEFLSITGEDAQGNEITLYKQMADKRFEGLRGVWTSPEMVAAFKEYYHRGSGPEELASWLGRGWMKVIAYGKFNQVILNPLSALPTNVSSSISFELLNGRMSLTRYGKGLRVKEAAKKGKGGSWDLADQEAVNAMTGKDFLAQDGWGKLMNARGMETEMLSRGALDENVFVEEINRVTGVQDPLQLTASRARQAGKGFAQFHTNIYQAPDNAAKFNAFQFEATKYMRAFPDWTVSKAFDMAARDVRATTQTYSEVNRALRSLSMRGLAPTYISFIHELYRNVWNTAKLGLMEIRSDNAVIKRYGFRRLAAMQLFLGALAAAAKVAPELAGTDDEEWKILRRWAVAPWHEGRMVAPMEFDRDNLKFRYFDPSYSAPMYQVWDSVAIQFQLTDDTPADERFMKSLSLAFREFGEQAILSRAVMEAITNKKMGGGPVFQQGWQELEDPIFGTTALLGSDGFWKIQGARLLHIAKNAVMPGYAAQAERIRQMKIQSEEEAPKAFGRIYSADEEIWRMFSVRPQTLSLQDYTTSKLIEFDARYRSASRIQRAFRDPYRLSEEQWQRQLEDETKAKENVVKEFTEFMADFKKLGIDFRKAKDDAKARNVNVVGKDFFDRAMQETAHIEPIR